MRGRRSGSWERVEAARRQARLALGKDPDGQDDYGSRPKPRSPLLPPPAPTRIASGDGERVLIVGEAAQRLGISRAELEALIAAGKLKTLPIEFGGVVSTSEDERLARAR